MSVSRADQALGDVRAVSVVRGNTNLSKHLPELQGHTWPAPGARAGTRALRDPVAAFGADPTGTCHERGNTTEDSCLPHHLPSHPHPCIIAIIWHLPSPYSVPKHVTRPHTSAEF